MKDTDVLTAPAVQHLASSSHPGSNIAAPVISSDYTRTVATTVNIKRPLPNAVFTLPAHVITAIIGRAALSKETRQQLPATCRKFYLAHQEYENGISSFVLGKTTIELYGGRLYTDVSLSFHPFDEVTEKPLRISNIRIPPVLHVWTRGTAFFAKTKRGLYRWSCKMLGGELGVTSPGQLTPDRVRIKGEVLDVCPLDSREFIRTSAGWFGSGENYLAQLGLGDRGLTPHPVAVPGSDDVIKWMGTPYTTFAVTDKNRLLACGGNGNGQAGSEPAAPNRCLTRLTPVPMPDDVRVNKVVGDSECTFFDCGERWFACGSNDYHKLCIRQELDDLGVGHVFVPTELDIHVDQLCVNAHITIVQSGNRFLAFGFMASQIFPENDTEPDYFFVPIYFHRPVSAIFLSEYQVCVKFDKFAGLAPRWFCRGLVGRDEVLKFEFDGGPDKWPPHNTHECSTYWMPMTKHSTEFLENQLPSDTMMVVQ